MSAGVRRAALAPSAPPQVRFGVNQVTTYRWQLDEDVVGYRDAGINSMGLWRPKLAEFGEERGVDLVLDMGMTVSSLSWVGGFTGANGHSYEEALHDAAEAIDLAGRLRSECVIVVSGSRALHIASHARNLLVDALEELGDRAALAGTQLALLPMHTMFARDWTFLTTLDEAVEVLDRVDHPAVQLAFNAYHLWQEPELLERIPSIARRTAVVQLSDWRDPPRHDLDRCHIGDGVIPLADIVRAFTGSGFRGHYEVEIWSEDLWASDYTEVLDTCRSRFDALWAD